jgi:extracellular elastinolytic metalloproteinase
MPKVGLLTVVLVALLGVSLPAAAFAVGPNERRDGRSLYDDRTKPRNVNRVATPPAQREAAADRLSSRLGTKGQVALDRVTATPRSIAKLDGFLTGPSSAGAEDVALGYVKDHPDLFGLDAGEVDALRLTKSYTDILGTTHLVWAQVTGGVPAIDNGIRAAVTKDGRLVNVGGSPLAGLSVGTTPKLTAAEALQAARDDAGIKGARPPIEKASSGARRQTEFKGDNQAKLAIYSTFGGPRLVWRVIADKSSTQLYDYVIDASTGEVLHRDNTVDFATGLAWDYFPGPVPLNNSGVATSRDFTAAGWLASNATTLSGNNGHTYLDLLDDNTPAAGDEVPPSSGSNWNYSLSRFNDGSFFTNCSIDFPCSWDSFTANSWQTNMKQNATQIFYFVNKFHDYLQASPIGFTEAAGNFQVTNSTGQGAGGDAVQAQALDGANTSSGFPDDDHFNNANMNTFADGRPPRMQMYLMSGLSPNGGDVNSGDDASVIYHEYTHGLSSRLVTDNDGQPALDAQQAGSMGEGWSDWYAMDFLVNHGFDADTAEVGDVNPAYYVAGGPGFRTQPLDCPVDFTDSPCLNFDGAGDGGYTYADFGKVVGEPEVHADGEIWHQTLWELRQRLIAKYGAAAGDQRVQTYVTRGMEFTPPFPSMIDARNGIMQAETVATAAGGPFAGSNDDDVLWATFAKRGMGYFAAALDGDDVSPIANFSLPPAPGAPHGTLTGTVTMTDGGSPASGARVEIGGHNSGLGSDLAATAGPTGAYTIANVPNGTYPYVFVGGPGFDRAVTANVTVTGTTTRNFTARRNWAVQDGGGTVDSFSPPDLSGNGCGPGGAIDGSLKKGWGSTSPTSTTGPGGAKQITIKLSRTITLSQYAVDPGATCGDTDSASVGSYKIETSVNGTTFTQTNTGTFSAANNHKLNLLTPASGTANVRYVRFTMNAPQAGTGSGHDWMDMSELKVYGIPVVDAATRSDFNGDGYADLAIAVPGEDFTSAVDGGLVHVVYGSASGLDASTAQAWSATSSGVVGTTNASDRFGAAVTAGDFNGDGYDDLAIGAPGDAAGAVANAGSVTILRGSAGGITGSGSVQITQNSGSVPDTAEAADGFGSALAAANMGGTSQDDLAIGVPGENSGAGAVNVLSGSATGLSTTSGALEFFQANAAGATEAGDGFGSSLAAGDLGKTATSDLAIGAPGEDNPSAADSGAVSVLYSSASGLAGTGAQTIVQSTASVPGNDVAGDQLGFAVAIGDVTGSGTTGDLAAGMPGKDVSAKNDAGQVLVLPGSATGVTATGSHVRDQDTTGVLDTAEAGDRFGASLVAADLAGAVKADLAIGVPGESVGAVAGAGQIAILLGTTGQVTATNNQIWGQDHAGISDTAETGDHFGASLAVGQWGNTSRLDLAVGVPDENVGTVADAGALNVIYGGTTALTTTGQKLLHQNAVGMPDNAETGDGLSRALGQGG